MSDSASVARFIFKNGEGELRSGWRVLIFLVTFQIFTILIGGIIILFGAMISGDYRAGAALLNEPPVTEPITTKGTITTTLSRGVLLASALAASALCARLLERRSFASVGYKLHKGWLKDFGGGWLLGAALLGLAVGIAFIAGAATFQFREASLATILTNAAILFVSFLIAGAFEEVLFRGFMFQALLHNFQIMMGAAGAVVPIAITSLAFGVVHLLNPDATLFSLANTVLAGVWLGVAYLKTRSLWLATALHAAWNFTMVFLFGLPVSGITMYEEMALARGEGREPFWLSGGDYGPEGGAAATAALILCTIVIILLPVFRASEEMIAATEHGSLSPKGEPKPEGEPKPVAGSQP